MTATETTTKPIFTFERDWENDGTISYRNAQTLTAYHELNKERDSCSLSNFDMFCAFSKEQFAQGKASIRPLKEGEKLVSIGGGVFGTRDGISRWEKFAEDIRAQIALRCDPQEVYCYEFNNYECCIAYDGDMNAILRVADIFGWERASGVKRFNAYHSLEELKGGVE